MKKFLHQFLPSAIAITLIFVSLYFVLTKEIRQAANNPQIEVAEEALSILRSGTPPITLFSGRLTDMATRLKTFQIIYNDEGKSLGANAYLDGEVPVLPIEKLDEARKRGESRFTWEPKEGVRIAAVVMKLEGENATSTMYVLAGRSLREIDRRLDDLLKNLILGWAITIILMTLMIWILNRKENEEIKQIPQ